MRRTAVLMTDPRHFAIKGGANPHTRARGGTLKSVEAPRAWSQWHSYVDALLDAGIDVYVAEAQPSLTGMVFAANAGFIPERLADRPVEEKRFFPSHFTAEHRRPEAEHYREFMRGFGFEICSYDDELRFEGEADAFPVGRGADRTWVFTYGFRSDPEAGEWLERSVVDTPVHHFELSDPQYYHGDCAICDLGGPVLAWPEALEEQSAARLREVFGDRLVPLDEADGAAFVGNSFYAETDDGRVLFASDDISGKARSRIEERGVQVIAVDVSEFFGKGGGGPKCLVFNLGEVDRDASEALPAVRDFRRRRHVENLRRQDYFPDSIR